MRAVEQRRSQPLVLGVAVPGRAGSPGLLRLLAYLGLLAGVVLIGLPMYWMLLAAFKTNKEIFSMPPTWIPLAPTLENFPAAWNQAPFGHFYINSLLYTLVGGTAKLLQAI